MVWSQRAQVGPQRKNTPLLQALSVRRSLRRAGRGCRVKWRSPWAQKDLPGGNVLNSNWKRRNEGWVRRGPHPPQSNNSSPEREAASVWAVLCGYQEDTASPAVGGHDGSGNLILKNQGALLLGLLVLFVLRCFHTLPHPQKDLKQFSTGMFPAEKCFEGRKKKAGSKGQNNDKWTQAAQRGERSGVRWLDRLVPVEPIVDDSISWTVMRTWTKPGSVDLEKGPVDFENGGTMLQNLQPLNTNGIWWVKEKKNNSEVSSLAQVKWKHY